jgi:hypothetical protein
LFDVCGIVSVEVIARFYDHPWSLGVRFLLDMSSLGIPPVSPGVHSLGLALTHLKMDDQVMINIECIDPLEEVRVYLAGLIDYATIT